METILLLGAKSFVIAGGALLLLQLMRKRSAADRSWIAHLALGALLLLPVAAFALPSLDVEGPAFLVGDAQQAAPALAPVPAALPAAAEGDANAAPDPAAPPTAAQAPAASPVDWPFWGYAVPVAVLLLLTLIALGRLFVLKSRATVLVEPEWLTALAHAQRRMGFKHGTALLTSDELPSPISWGVIRPVILLNTAAARSHDEAEAIITHELAHVARLDWAKLMVSRVAVALFWFNPLVWMLAREAHQLREEAADDTVLAADIEDTDYAKLLVGVARHECRGMLLGAHGVAPGRNSLTRRVRRVLDTATDRAPGGWRWASAAGFFAAGMAVPVAALNLVAPSSATTSDASPARFATDTSVPAGGKVVPELGDIISHSASTAVAAALAAANSAVVHPEVRPGIVSRHVAPGGATVTTMASGMTVARAASGSTVTVYPPDKHGRRRIVARAPNGAIAESFADNDHPLPGPGPRAHVKQDSEIDRAIAMRAVGVTPEYVAALRAAAPHLGTLDTDDLVELKAVGVGPEFIREMASVGFRALDKEDLVEARAVGVRSAYVRELNAAGYSNLPLDTLIELRAVGVTAAYIEKLRRAGYGRVPVDKLVEMRAVGVDPDDLRRDGG
jgi:beta-lactamase regulating signal transducer with metallopeptidase domain